MTSDLSFALVSFGSIFSLVDPFAALPMFIALTGDQDDVGRRKIARKASLTCFLVLAVCAAIGPLLFRFFGITIAAFRIAGGILLFGVALEMVRAETSKTRTNTAEQQDAASRTDVGMIPLGIPLLAGPGSIASVMVLTGAQHQMSMRGILLGVLALVGITSFLILRSASRVAKFLGVSGMNLIARIMGLILAATSVQFVLDGLHDAFPKLFG